MLKLNTFCLGNQKCTFWVNINSSYKYLKNTKKGGKHIAKLVKLKLKYKNKC